MNRFKVYHITFVLGLVAFIIFYALPALVAMPYLPEPFVGTLFCPLLGIYGAYLARQDEAMAWMIANICIIPLYYIYTAIAYQIWIN